MNSLRDAEHRTENEAWLARFRESHAQASCRDHDLFFRVVFVWGQGARIWDAEGDDWIDLTCGYSANNFGHAWKPLVTRAQTQLEQLTHLTGEPHVGRVALAERLIDVCGYQPGRTKVLFNATGARAVESAWKAAHSYRPGKLLVLAPGFHGRSIATAAISDTQRTSLSANLAEHAVVWPAEHYPYCIRCPLQLTYPECAVQCTDGLIQFLQENHRQISAVMVEPALGARGYIFPPNEYFGRLRKVTQELGLLLIADEIQTGLGRCGSWLLSTVQGWQADLVVLGKSLGGGMVPISAVVGRAEVLDGIPSGAESETFAANPLACAVALQCLESVEEHQLFEAGQQIGARLRKAMGQLLKGTELDGRAKVDGVAAACVLDVVQEPDDPGRSSQLARQLALACRDQRLRVHWSGPAATRIVLLPPLTMNDEELKETTARLRRAMESLHWVH